MSYVIKKTSLSEISINDNEWEKANVGKVTKINWENYPNCPDTSVRVLHGDNGIFVKFVTDEPFVSAKETKDNGDVYKDSTCEIFFKPNKENPNYFNFEINAKGTPLIGFGKERKGRIRIPDFKREDFKIESEIFKEKGFALKFFIPYDFIKRFIPEIDRDSFLGNFQKCREDDIYPHFCSYYEIRTEKPDFHVPKNFEMFILE